MAIHSTLVMCGAEPTIEPQSGVVAAAVVERAAGIAKLAASVDDGRDDQTGYPLDPHDLTHPTCPGAGWWSESTDGRPL